jgi:Peptidase family C25
MTFTMKKIIYVFINFFFFYNASAQMWNGKDTIYGNEWINFSQKYYKMKIADDGIYRLDYKTLAAAGVPLANVKGNEFKIFALGKEIPLHVSNSGNFAAADYIEFYARKNRGELDKELFQKPDEEQMNPTYSMYTDSMAYYLTWSPAVSSRFATINNNIVNPPAKETYFLHRWDSTFFNGWDKKSRSGDGIPMYISRFDLCEGFASTYAKNREITPYLYGIVKNGIDAKLSMRLGFAYIWTKSGNPPPAQHVYEVRYNNQALKKDSFANTSSVMQLNDLNIANADLMTKPIIKIDSKGGVTDDHRIANISIQYARNFDFENKAAFLFTIEAASQARYIEIEKFDVTGGAVVLYDITNNQRLLPTVENGIVKILLPPSAINRNLAIWNEKNIKTPALQNIIFNDLTKQKGNFIILTHATYFKDVKNNNANWVQEYANYRSTSDGGNYQSVIVEYLQINEQFGYGIDYHAQGLHNFSNYIAKNWQPKLMLIVGRAAEYRNTRGANYFKNNPTNMYVPTYGFPGADNLIPASKKSLRQAFGIGRLAINEPNDLRIYLNKIKDFDRVQRQAQQTIEDKAWMKNIIHLAGDDKNFNSTLLNMGDVLIKNQFGASLSQYYKASSDPVEVSNNDAIRDRIQKGASIVNYFGHSAASNISYPLDGPAELNNKDRYFYFLAHGCYTGQIHVPYKTIGSGYIFQENGGAIAFSAPGHYGYDGQLAVYGNTFYGLLGGQDFGQPLGTVITNTINAGGPFNEPILNNMTLAGDPAVVLNPAKTADYTFDLATANFEPSVVTTLTDRFKFKCRAYNLGRHTKEKIALKLVRELPDGSKIVVKKDTIDGFGYTKDLVYDIQGFGENSAGLNKFYLKIDDDNVVKEQPIAAEGNNELNFGKGIELRIRANDVTPVAPNNFVITSKKTPKLIALASTTKKGAINYIIEIDSTANFNSPIKQKKVIVQEGGLLEWAPSFNYQDSTVYYWRATADSVETGNYNWRTSSFMYSKNINDGWNQSHFFQFLDNDFTYMDLLKKDRRFSYQGNKTGLVIRNNFEEVFRPGIGINDENNTFFWPTLHKGEGAGALIFVFNDTTGLPWKNKLINGKGYYNSDLNGGTYQKNDYFFPYRTTLATTREDMINFLEKIVPSKSYVLVMMCSRKVANYKPQDWAKDSTATNGGKNLFNVLEKQGAKKFRQLEKLGSVPYIYFYRKDDPTYASAERIWDPQNPDNTIGYSTELQGFWYKGAVKSTTIGPVSQWNKIEWSQAEGEKKDSTFLNVYAINKQGKTDTLYKKTLDKNLDISNLPANIYPYLKLEWYTQDSLKRSSPQLNFWRVLHKGLPEVIPNTSKLSSITADTVAQGQDFNVAFAVQNVSEYDMKNVLVRYLLKKSDNTQTVFYQRLNALKAQDTVIARYKFDTRKLEKVNSLTIQINPNLDQPESDTTNNGLFYEFFVKKDVRNPLLEVTFDGQKIVNGDIISPEPNIVVQLRDENKFLLLNDTSVFKIYLRKPDENTASLLNFDDKNIVFYPATNSKNNKATVEYNPTFLKDGDYSLLIRCKDMTENKVSTYVLDDKDKLNADLYNYKVDFKIVTKSSISNILNYPNPFTTATRFAYTMTGKEPPAYFKIQVMTISGKVVRELTQTELGTLRTGTHLTDYAWDGTDQFGDRLANGVYLYKMIAKKANGEDYENYQSGADEFLKNGIGKMVILR